MSLSELLVICLVALLVFDAKKLPMLAHHLGIAVRVIREYIQTFQQAWKSLSLAHQLAENEHKAKAAELDYTLLQKEKNNSTELSIPSSKDTSLS